MKSLLSIYPGSIVSEELCVQDGCLCFFDENSQRYISIPKTEISENEIVLLQSFLKPADEVNQMSLKSPEENKWFQFLFSRGEVPATIKKRTRLVHFHLIGKIERTSFAEAVRHFWPVPFVIVWMHEDRGMIVEQESEAAAGKDELESLAKVLESDFYFSVRFYAGRFYETDESLRTHYTREQTYFLFAEKRLPQIQSMTFEVIFPILLLGTEKEKLNMQLSEEAELIFGNEPELRKTIKLFIENNSNVTLTAKQLHLHRNSLQYRIDRFIERSGIDIKTYKGALVAYFICLQSEGSE
ncbi:PucR family transcriptional regulator [Bacillus vallismortis]|uniref:PucR family transcriptional regulator n=1 Tax=Bacillus vallismortis TaxID=72361 RepID=UPI002090D300|nr:helix-turn-helix domain-containing protein [Bacillus vallismortis]MCO4852576.1 helix-turn-helix domain-containing protein [Bacillus vallismortis]